MKKSFIIVISLLIMIQLSNDLFAMDLVKGVTSWEEIKQDDSNAWVMIEFYDSNSSWIYSGYEGYVENNNNIDNYCFFYSDNSSYKLQAAYMTEAGTINIYKKMDIGYQSYSQFSSSTGELYKEYSNENYLQFEKGVYWDEVTVLNSNRYVFDNEDNARAYLESGSIEGLINPDDVLPYMFDLEVPQNVQVNYSDSFFDMDPEYDIEWDQSVEESVNWDTEFKVYFDYCWRKAVLGISFADWNYVRNNFLMNDLVKCRTGTYIVDKNGEASSKFIDDYLAAQGLSGTVATVDSYDVYMRNRYLDANGKLHLSNWVRVEITDGTGFVSSPDEGSIEVRKTELEGSVDDSVEKPTGNAVVGSQYDGSNTGTTMNQNSADLVGYIRNGFGILGDNGVVSLLSKSLTFVPDEFWSIILIGVGLMVVIGVVKFVRG